ncbi:MAG: PAS domain-containing sensor histidine kinase, partial [Paludibacter sp.]
SNSLRLTDLNGVIVRANKSFCDLFEVSENEVIGKLMSDLYHKNSSKEELIKYKTKFVNGTLDQNKEKEIILWNNKKKWVEINKTYIFPSDDTKLLLTVFNEITTRKEAELTLAVSEAKYRELMDNSPEGITIYVDGKIAYINKEAMNVMRAKDKSELIGRSLFEFIHPDNIALILERMKFVAITPLNVSLPAVEEKYLRLDGTEVDVEIKVMPILFDGQPAVQISGHDITEKKIANEEIEKNRKELKAIYDNAPVMMCVVNDSAQILFANNALNTFVDEPAKLVGLNPVFGNVLDCVNSFLKPQGCGFSEACKNCILRHTIETTFSTGQEHRDIDYQTTIVKNGIKRKVSLLASTSLIEDGGIKRLLLCMTDITARKEAEDALQKSEALLRTFIDNIPFGVWARDMNNKIIIQNSKLIENFGSILHTDVNHYSKKDLQTAKKWAATNKRAYAGEIVNEEVFYTVKGNPIPFQNIVFPIRSNNVTFGIAGINIDISERLKAQKELLDYQHQLKDFAKHLQTVREEERVNLAREIHDDLGQILVAIKFDLGMLGVKSKKFVKEEAVADFQTQFKRLEVFVNNTIKSARRIMTDLRPELLDMVGLVEAFKEHIKAFNERQIIHCEFLNKTTAVEIAPEKSIALFRILQESLNNAVKHSQASLIDVEMGCENNITYLQISDNGVGFDLAMKKRNDSYGLTGMKERAYLLEGTVSIWSEPGKGVKIRVEVPNK